MKHKSTLLAIIFVGLSGLLYEAEAQIPLNVNDPRAATPSYFKFTEPGDIPMYVHIWGYVYRPGLYELPVGTQLSTVLSLSGGFALGALSSSQKRIVTLELKNAIGSGDQPNPIYKETWIDSQIQLTQDPILVDGSFVVIDSVTKRKFNWRDGITIVGALASVAIAIERLSNL